MAGSALGQSARGARPNILIIMVDQMREPMWTPQLDMPNLERLRQNGVSFSNSFCAASPCSPSRACFFTGTHSTQNRMFYNCDFVEGDIQPSLDPAITTIGHIFKNAGYRTPYRGKWHLTKRKDRPDKLESYGFEGWKPPDAWFGGPPWCGEVFDPMYARQAVKWLSDPDNHEDPWLMVCSLVNPHDVGAWPRYYPHTKLGGIKTEEPPPNWTDDLSGKPRVHKEYQKRFEKMAGKVDVDNPDQWRRYLDWYVACMEDVDENMGDVMDALEKSGQAGNTLVLFTSDHGEMGGSHKLRNKGTFAYEEVMKVPLVLSMPGTLPAGKTSDALVSNVDVMPTLCSFAGISPANYMAGVDFSHILSDPSAEAKRDHVIYHNDWEIVFTVGKGENEGSTYDNPAHIRSIRDNEWKYAYYFALNNDDHDFELYNLKEDPLEMTNLANDAGYKKKRKELHARLMEIEDGFEKDFRS